MRNGFGRHAWVLVTLAAWVAWLPNAAALGVRIPNQDAGAIARANAFVATADNPSAIYYNPAGITQLKGHQVQVGSLFYLGIYGDYESPSGQRVENDEEVLAAPTLYYTFSPETCPLSFGFGANTPFGFSVDWPDDAPFRTGGYDGKLTYLTLNPVVAWRLHPTLSIAAGPTFNYSKIELHQGILPAPGLGDEFKFDGDGWSYGFNVGLLWQPHERWSFGASYRSASRMDYDGDATFRLPANSMPPVDTSTELEFPQIVIAGISYRPNAKWNIEFDVDWADWSSVDKLSFSGIPVQQTLNWHSSFMYEFGVTRYFSRGYYASIGYFFSEASTSERYFTPLVPDTDLHIGSIGGGYKGARWSWAVAVQIIGGDWRDVNDAANPDVDGRYRLFTPTLSCSIGYRF